MALIPMKCHAPNAYAAHRDRGDDEKVPVSGNRQPSYPHLISSTGHGLCRALEGKFSG
jgi:hypothetical protein